MSVWRIAGALVLSAILHLAALVGTGFEWPAAPDDAGLARLEARMVRAAADRVGEPAPVRATPRPKPKPKPKREAAVEVAAAPVVSEPVVTPPAEPLPDPAPEPVATDTPSAEEPQTAEPSSESVPADPRSPGGSSWPVKGQITYAILRGEPGFDIGRAVHRWDVQPDGRYHLMAVTETTGLAAAFRPVKVTQASIGRLTPSGFQPHSFMMRRDGHPAPVRAAFDWNHGILRQSESEGLLPVGTQDQLSVFYQVGYPGYPQRVVEVPIATGRRLVGYRFEVLGEEMLDLPFGMTWRTLHVIARHEETTEIWLALDHFSLPVKIRHIDRKGDVYDQIALEILVAKNATHPPPP